MVDIQHPVLIPTSGGLLFKNYVFQDGQWQSLKTGVDPTGWGPSKHRALCDPHEACLDNSLACRDPIPFPDGGQIHVNESFQAKKITSPRYSACVLFSVSVDTMY